MENTTKLVYDEIQCCEPESTHFDNCCTNGEYLLYYSLSANQINIHSIRNIATYNFVTVALEMVLVSGNVQCKNWCVVFSSPFNCVCQPEGGNYLACTVCTYDYVYNTHTTTHNKHTQMRAKNNKIEL